MRVAIQLKVSTIKTSSRGVVTTLSILGASAVLTITNPSPAHADTNNYTGHTVDIETSGDRWSHINYPWDGLDPQTQIYGGRNGSATTADFTAQSDVKELGLFADVGKKLKGLGFVRHGTGGFFYLKSNPSLAAVKVDNEGRLCLISRKDNKAFHSLDFDDLMQKCRELNALHNSGQEAVAINPNASRSITARLNLKNSTVRRIISDQDANINHIVEITQQYSQEGSLDKIAEQANRLRRLASKLKNPDSLFALNITNTSVYGSVEGQPNYGTIGADFGKDPVTTVYGDYKRATSLDKTTRRLLARRFEQELIKVQGVLNYYISHPEAKDFSIRYILSNYIAQGGVLPEGVIAGGEGTVSREIEGGRARTIEEPMAREERPVETERNGELPCEVQLPLLKRLAAFGVKRVIAQRAERRSLTTFIAVTNLDGLSEGSLAPQIDKQELIARNCNPDLEREIKAYRSNYDFEHGEELNLKPKLENTVLKFDKLFEPTKKYERGAKVYKAKFDMSTSIKKGYLYYIDTGHAGHAAEIEIFDRFGDHQGAMTLEGKLKQNSRVPGRHIKID